jgi:hypothetical protein
LSADLNAEAVCSSSCAREQASQRRRGEEERERGRERTYDCDDLLLDEAAKGGTSEPVADVVLRVVDRDVEAVDGYIHLLDLEERLAILLLGVLDRDGAVQTPEKVSEEPKPSRAPTDSHIEPIARAASNVNVQQTVVLKSNPSRLLLDVVRDVFGLQPEAREADGGRGGELGSVGGVALLDGALVVVLEEHAVGDERVGGEAHVVDDEVDVGGLWERGRHVSSRLGDGEVRGKQNSR